MMASGLIGLARSISNTLGPAVSAVFWDQRYGRHLQILGENSPVDSFGFAGAVQGFTNSLAWMGEVAALVPAPAGESSQTTHLSVIDRNGNAVSLTTTLNGTFGSGILVPGGGFLLNNELDDFSIQAGTPNMFGLVGSRANQLAPGKRPLSSMTPTVVREGGRRVSLVIGSPGGPRIITSVAQVMLRVLAYGQDLQSAVRAPRLHQQWRPAETRFELAWDETLLDELARDHGHRLREPEDKSFGSVQAIWIGPDRMPVGVSDPRRGGAWGMQGREVSTPARP